MATNSSSLSPVFQLTRRQHQVCQLLVEGWTRRQIAVLLQITYNTVQIYCRDIRQHYGVNSTHEALVRWQQGEVVYAAE